MIFDLFCFCPDISRYIATPQGVTKNGDVNIPWSYYNAVHPAAQLDGKGIVNISQVCICPVYFGVYTSNDLWM